MALLQFAWPSPALPGQTFSVVTLEPAVLSDAVGAQVKKVKAYTALELVQSRGKRLAVRPVQAPPGRRELFYLDRSLAALVMGPAAEHTRRLQRLRKMSLPAVVSRRLASGSIQTGDSLWHVELAWGRPQRSFMVNYLSDEQHFVYLFPGRRPVLLRFEQGKLVEPVAAPRKQDIMNQQGPVEKAPPSR